MCLGLSAGADQNRTEEAVPFANSHEMSAEAAGVEAQVATTGKVSLGKGNERKGRTRIYYHGTALVQPPCPVIACQ